MDESYPLTYSVDYPDRQLNRLSTFFRIFAVIPIAIVLADGVGRHYTYSAETTATTTFAGRPAASCSPGRC